MTSPTLPKRYEVRSLLGEGGQGRVYRVQDSIRDRELALKLVTPDESAFLRREFDTLRQIRHENLIQVFDWGTLPGGEAYYTMELIEGGDWSRRMGKPQPADEVRHVLTGLLRGLAHLHCHGEIHGDLKPENILLGAGGVVKITDTGMGGRGGSGSGMTGTPGYAAPEVWEGAAANVRSDLYSVGVMGYEALTGRHPFEGRTVRQVVSGQLEGWVPTPGAYGVDVPADLERVVMRALERQPGLRQGSGDEFMEGFGVEDRIGEILGGKLVGRESELGEIDELLHSEKAGMPTVLSIRGEPGIGKTALVEEASARLVALEGRTLQIDLGSPSSIAEQLGLSGSPSDAESRVKSALELATELFDLARKGPLLLCVTGVLDHVSSNSLQSLGRYLWALSLESAAPSRVVIALCGDVSGEAFGKTIDLAPLDEAGSRSVVRGILGADELQAELIARLHALSGGNPGILRSALASFVDRGLLQRRDGRWTFREAAQIHSLGLETGANPWVIAWKHLNESERTAILTLAIFRRPVPTSRVEQYMPGLAIDDVLSGLTARGWIRNTREGWAPASDGVRQAAQDLADPGSQSDVAEAILRATPKGEPSDEILDLELRYRPTPEVLERGIESAERTRERGDQISAVERLRRCFEIARDLSLMDRARNVSLRVALLLHQLGVEDEAEAFLDGDPWMDGAPSAADAGTRLHLLGQIAMARGDLTAARDRLNEAIKLAGDDRNTALLLRCHSDLAEIDWRHGDAALRAGAIARVRSVLDDHPSDSELRDERVALMYQLGSATIVAGASREAIGTLRAGFELAGTDYWRMRLANALSSAYHYVGDTESGFEWLDKAWRFAESSSADSFKARILSNRAGLYVNLGQFAEATEQDQLSAMWARRFGNTFEYAAGRAGSGICAIHLARYEDALSDARETRQAAQTLNNYGYLARAHELEGLVYHVIGRNDRAEAGVSEALAICRKHGYTVVKPRLEWLLARILRERGDEEESERLLQEAEAQLLETRDLEDLWGVQIEMNLGLSADGRAATRVDEIEALFRKAEERGLLVVAVPAALAISEILLKERLDHVKYRSLLAVGLQMAEGSGMRESAWRLSFGAGVLAARDGQRKEAYSRFTLASRLIREIAGELSDGNRGFYLRSTHVTSALKQMAPALSN